LSTTRTSSLTGGLPRWLLAQASIRTAPYLAPAAGPHRSRRWRIAQHQSVKEAPDVSATAADHAVEQVAGSLELASRRLHCPLDDLRSARRSDARGAQRPGVAVPRREQHRRQHSPAVLPPWLRPCADGRSRYQAG